MRTAFELVTGTLSPFTELCAAMGFFGVVLKPGEAEAVEVPPGWCLQLCTAALEPAKAGVKVKQHAVYGASSSLSLRCSPAPDSLWLYVRSSSLGS